jgi:hypothetical protein
MGHNHVAFQIIILQVTKYQPYDREAYFVKKKLKYYRIITPYLIAEHFW